VRLISPDTDSVYSFTSTFSHSTPSVVIAFRGAPTQGITDEWWAIDNVVVTANP
jgi:hypothetical protein